MKKSLFGLLSLSVSLLLGGCCYPYFTGGNVPVKAMIVDAKADTSGWLVAPGNEVPKGRVPGRYVVVTFYTGYEWAKPDGIRLLDAYLMHRQGRQVNYPLQFHVSFWGPFSQGSMAWTLDREEWAFIAFAPECWPAAAREGHPDARKDLERPTLISRRYDAQAGLTKKIPRYPAKFDDQLRLSHPETARASFYPRGRSWGNEVCRNVADAAFLPRHTPEFIELIDNCPDLTDADRLMVFRQTLEVVQRMSVRIEELENPELHDVAKALLRERILVLCRGFGLRPPPGPGDNEALLAIVKSAVASKGIKEASSEWLGVAIDEEMAKCAEYLLTNGADPLDKEPFGGREPLTVAARRGNINIAKALLAADARKANFYANKGRLNPSLNVAVVNGRREMAEFLLNLGASANAWNVDSDPNCKAPLTLAAKSGDRDMVALLLKHGAKVDFHFRNTGTALWHACGEWPDWNLRRHTQADRAKTVELLLAHGANVNDDSASDSPLHAAVRARLAQVVRVLLEHGANVNSRNDPKGRTPLKVAMEIKAPGEIIRMLRSHGGKE